METRYEEEGLKERTREIEKSIIKRFRKEALCEGAQRV